MQLNKSCIMLASKQGGESGKPYLGMTIVKTSIGYKICMRACIEDVLKLYGKPVHEYVTPATKHCCGSNGAGWCSVAT